jgi:hypothetical protein
MKKIIFAVICSLCILGSSVSYSQDSSKSVKKDAKAMKKEDKGKHHKAMKKTAKMEKKEAKDK